MDGDFYVDYAHLDSLQIDIIREKFHNHMVVKGKAGTGKSLIALHKLGRVGEDKKAILIVFTKSLEQYFKDGFKALDISQQTVFHYDDWIPQDADYIFVDECQDFSRAQIQSFIDHAQYCYFFGDDEQSIYEWRSEGVQSVDETAKMVNVDAIELFKNYRLTKENARLAEYVGKDHNLVSRCEKTGAKPRLFTGATIEEQLDDMIRIIQNGNLTKVGILLPMNDMDKANRSYDTQSHISVQYVKNYLDAHNMPSEAKISSEFSDLMELDFTSPQPKVLTWSCAKGLQFNDVFIPFCENKFEEKRRKQLYVAITRAWNRLYIGYTGHINEVFLPKEDTDFYEHAEQIDNI